MILERLNQWLKGQPDKWLTIILILLGIFAIIVAFKGPPLLKATVAAWFIAP
jgi:uncharacterized membrane protein HdeD (DUF308 family)